MARPAGGRAFAGSIWTVLTGATSDRPVSGLDGCRLEGNICSTERVYENTHENGSFMLRILWNKFRNKLRETEHNSVL